MLMIHVLFDNNNLSGTIPSSLGLMKTLEVVRLDRNSITGPIPNNINNLTNLKELHLSNNKLNGPLPNLTGMELLSYVQLRNNFLNGTVDLGTDYGNILRRVDLQNNKIEDVLGGGEQQSHLILAGNPYCDKRGRESTHICAIPPPPDSYSTPTSNCQQTDCSFDQKLSPRCKCAYPYVGTLIFLFNFSNLMDKSNYEALENKMTDHFQSQGVPVDSVALHDVTICSNNYLQISLQIFPSRTENFTRSSSYKIGYILGSGMHKALEDFGSYIFNVRGYDCAEGKAYTSKSKNILVIIGASIGVFILAVAMIALVVYAARMKRKAQRVVERNKPFASWDRIKGGGDAPRIRGPKWFSFDELKRSTNNFSEANSIGTGSYGKVYQGMLVTGQHVAIKRAQQGSAQGGHEFKTEIELLSRVHHKNIVALVGFCFDQGEQMLVYEYIPNGTLRDSLSGKSGIHLDWRKRLKIALGISRGLAYLHELADPPIIHRDVKSNNILLDDCLNAKVADFGICKPMSDGLQDHVTTQVKGTMGYMDPEYYMTQLLTEKSDVYSFGVMLLELLTARRPIEKGKYVVAVLKASMDKTKDLYDLIGIVDPSIRVNTSICGFEKFVDLAMRCVEDLGVDRPAMSQSSEGD